MRPLKESHTLQYMLSTPIMQALQKHGHVGTHCPRRVEQLIQKRKNSKRRYNAKKAAARSKASARRLSAVCTQCKKPYHQRIRCPDLPCKHYNTIGHVGTDCPDRKEELADATRKAKRRYNKRIAAAGRGAPSAGNHNSWCSQCRQPGHRRPACPQLPCGRCSIVGHVVTDCPLKAKEVKQWMRDAQTRHKREETQSPESPHQRPYLLTAINRGIGGQHVQAFHVGTVIKWDMSGLELIA